MIRELREKCTEGGFDLCDPIYTQWYNDLIEEEGHVARGTLKKIPSPPTITDDAVQGGGEEGGEGEEELNFEYNAVLIGNSKSIWPKFISWLALRYEKELAKKNGSEVDDHCNRNRNPKPNRSKEEILDEVLNDNPFDTFVTETLSRVLRSCCLADQLASYEFYWSNGIHYKVDLDAAPRNNKESSTNTTTTTTTTTTSAHENNDDYHCYYEKSSLLVSMQRVAKLTGKYWHDEEGTKLCVHPQFGTWKAFRAIVVFHKIQKVEDMDDTNNPLILPVVLVPKPPPMCPCPVDEEEIQKAKEVMDYALKMSTGNSSSNSNSNSNNNSDSNNTGYGGSSPSINTDLCSYLHNSVTSGSDWSKVSPTMRPWIQLRDCISVGRQEYKYCDNQLLYHYTKDADILRKELKNVHVE